MITRREWIVQAAMAAGAVVIGGASSQAAERNFAALTHTFASIEKGVGGRLGVAVLDTNSGARFGYRDRERFPMCSTFKVLLVAAVLKRVDEDRDQLDRVVRYTQSDVIAWAPVTKKHVPTGMTVEALCGAAITVSDNTAANLLLKTIGGPAGVTAFARGLGDEVTRLDRNEPSLNTAIPGDPRDTSTPMRLVCDLQRIALGEVLAASSRKRLVGWMLSCQTGDGKLRAGFPRDWKIADKTGSGERGTENDLAIVWPAGHTHPLFVSAYLTGATRNHEQQLAAIAAVGKAVADVLKG